MSSDQKEQYIGIWLPRLREITDPTHPKVVERNRKLDEIKTPWTWLYNAPVYETVEYKAFGRVILHSSGHPVSVYMDRMQYDKVKNKVTSVLSSTVVRWIKPCIPNAVTRSGPTVPTCYAVIGKTLHPLTQNACLFGYSALALGLDKLRTGDNGRGYYNSPPMSFTEEALFAQWGIEHFKKSHTSTDVIGNACPFNVKPVKLEECAICHADGSLGNVLWPCCDYHQACMDCCKQMERCPICRQDNDGPLKILSNIDALKEEHPYLD